MKLSIIHLVWLALILCTKSHALFEDQFPVFNEQTFIGQSLRLENVHSRPRRVVLQGLFDEEINEQLEQYFGAAMMVENTFDAGPPSAPLVLTLTNSELLSGQEQGYKLVPGALIGDLENMENVYVDFDLFFHQLLGIDHHPTKVTLYGSYADIEPLP